MVFRGMTEMGCRSCLCVGGMGALMGFVRLGDFVVKCLATWVWGVRSREK